jgi:hypothetical protein
VELILFLTFFEFLEGTDYTALPPDTTLVFSEGTLNGNTACAEIQTTENFAFNKYRVFSVNVELEEASSGITLTSSSADVHIMNDDSKCMKCRVGTSARVEQGGPKVQSSCCRNIGLTMAPPPWASHMDISLLLQDMHAIHSPWAFDP